MPLRVPLTTFTPIFHIAQLRANLWNQCEGTEGSGTDFGVGEREMSRTSIDTDHGYADFRRAKNEQIDETAVQKRQA